MIQRIRKVMGAALKAAKPEKRWPRPSSKYRGDEPRFLFIITPPFSGSTALSQILNTAPGSMVLDDNGEGQWLVPALMEDDRWDPNKVIDWESVRAVWMERIGFVQSLVKNVKLVIEKSPPNTVRMDQLANVFPNHAMIGFNRNPYANCASILYRNHAPQEKAEDERARILATLAEDWVFRSTYVKKWVEQFSLLLVTYESFCAAPDEQVAKIQAAIPGLEGINSRAEVKVKDYAPQGIVDQNPRQISKLSQAERHAISNVLMENAELVSYFGYNPDFQAGADMGGIADIPC